MFKPSEVWWKRHKSRVHLNWEFESEAKELQDVKEVARGAGGDYVPSTVAAARLAVVSSQYFGAVLDTKEFLAFFSLQSDKFVP